MAEPRPKRRKLSPVESSKACCLLTQVAPDCIRHIASYLPLSGQASLFKSAKAIRAQYASLFTFATPPADLMCVSCPGIMADPANGFLCTQCLVLVDHVGLATLPPKSASHVQKIKERKSYPSNIRYAILHELCLRDPMGLLRWTRDELAPAMIHQYQEDTKGASLACAKAMLDSFLSGRLLTSAQHSGMLYTLGTALLGQDVKHAFFVEDHHGRGPALKPVMTTFGSEYVAHQRHPRGIEMPRLPGVDFGSFLLDTLDLCLIARVQETAIHAHKYDIPLPVLKQRLRLARNF